MCAHHWTVYIIVKYVYMISFAHFSLFSTDSKILALSFAGSCIALKLKARQTIALKARQTTLHPKLHPKLHLKLHPKWCVVYFHLQRDFSCSSASSFCFLLWSAFVFVLSSHARTCISSILILDPRETLTKLASEYENCLRWHPTHVPMRQI